MALSHVPIKPFRPTGKGGGSKKGKPQGQWPWILKILADALYVRSAGSCEAVELGVMNLALEGETEDDALERLMNTLAPGWLPWADENMVPTKTRRATLLKNRVYKSRGYKGSSDQGKGCTPVRGKSREHWSFKFAETHQYHEVFWNVVRGKIVSLSDWQELIPLETQIINKRRKN